MDDASEHEALTIAAVAAGEAAVAHAEAAEAEAQADATETAAEAAVALAHAAAAEAEVQAAESVRDYGRELEECRTTIERLGESITTFATGEGERAAILADHGQRLERLSAHEERLARIEEHLHRAGLNPGSSNPETSGAEVASLGGTAQLGTHSGLTGEASLGPAQAEAGASLTGSEVREGASLGESHPARRRRRWI